MPFHLPSDVISPNSGREVVCSICFEFFGLNAACGWLFVLITVVVELTDVADSNEVSGLFSIAFVCGGRFFCNFVIPVEIFVGLLGALLFPGSLRYFSLLVRTASPGCELVAET